MRAAFLATALLLSPATALAGSFDACEMVIMRFVPDEDGGGADIAAFGPVDEFLASLETDAPMTTVGGHPIRAIMCTRNDLVPTEADYPILATGVMLALSQDFNSSDSDSLTMIFKDGAFQHTYNSAYPMSDELKDAIESQLNDFSTRNHGLGAKDTEMRAEVEKDVGKSDEKP